MINILEMFKELFRTIMEFEDNLLARNKKITLCLARLVGLGAIFLVSILCTVFCLVIGLVVIQRFNLPGNTAYKYWWALVGVFLLIFIVPFFSIVNKPNYNFSRKIYGFFYYITYRLEPDKSIEIKIFLAFIYSLIGTILTIYAMLNFINEQSLINYITTKKTLIFSIFIIYIAIYITLRIFFLPEANEKEKCIKLKKKFYLWTIAFGVILVYAIYTLNTTKNILDYPYYCIALLVAIDMAINSYKEFIGSITLIIN